MDVLVQLVVLLSLVFIPAFCQSSNGWDVGLIAAFGDFNSDKLTDLFVLTGPNNDPTPKFYFHVVKQQEHEPYFARDRRSSGCYSTETIASVIPGDFHGNTYMDVAVVTSPTDKSYKVFLVRGNTTHLACSTLSKRSRFQTSIQPLMLDYDGDMISDLLGEVDGKRTIWLGSAVNLSLSHMVTFPGSDPLKDSANAFVDVNADGIADIILHSTKAIEYWFSKDGAYGEPINGRSPIFVPYPDADEIGESTFTDINGDYQIDHLLPVVKNNQPMLMSLDMATHAKWTSLKLIPAVNSTDKDHSKLRFTSFELMGIKFPMMVRAGDYDSDGFQDFVTVMADDAGNRKVVLLMNKDGGNDTRAFQIQVIDNDHKALLGSFLDIEEDGKLDLIYSYANETLSDSHPEMRIVTERNPEDDANFVKILVASSNCPNKKCYTEDWIGKRYRVNYGTNQPGPFVRYLVTDGRGYDKKSCGGQLSQSSHFALQTPYIIFGLGPNVNYIREVDVIMPFNNGSKRSHLIEELVPDAQIILIPNPYDNPDKWVTKLFLFTSDIMYKTLYTLLGICVGLVLVIFFFHKREQIADAEEKKRFQTQFLDFRIR